QAEDGIRHVGASGAQHHLALVVSAARTTGILSRADRRCARDRSSPANRARAVCPALSGPPRLGKAMASGIDLRRNLSRGLRFLVRVEKTFCAANSWIQWHQLH